jgi:hypothetical protein
MPRKSYKVKRKKLESEPGYDLPDEYEEEGWEDGDCYEEEEYYADDDADFDDDWDENDEAAFEEMGNSPPATMAVIMRQEGDSITSVSDPSWLESRSVTRPRVEVRPKISPAELHHRVRTRAGKPPEETQMSDVSLALRQVLNELQMYAPSLSDPDLPTVDEMATLLSGVVSRKKLGEMTGIDFQREVEGANRELQRRKVRNRLSRRSGMLGTVPDVTTKLLSTDEQTSHARDLIEKRARRSFRSYLKNPFRARVAPID